MRLIKVTLIALRYDYGVQMLQDMYSAGELTPREYDNALKIYAGRRDNARQEVGRIVTRLLYRLMYPWMKRWLRIDDL